MKRTLYFISSAAWLIMVTACGTEKKDDPKRPSEDTPVVTVPGNDSLKAEIAALEKQLFGSREEKPDKELANRMIKAYTDFANANPKDEKAAEYYFKSGELSNSLGMPEAAIGYFKKVHDEYPQWEKASFALFLQGFVYENQLMDYNRAKEVYREVVKKYPNTQVASDAQASIDNMGKTPEQLIKEFEAKNNKK